MKTSIRSNKGFTLIEVIIASSILTIAVFWSYKLIWENTKIISNSSNYLQTNTLFPTIENCIENIWWDWFASKLVNDKYFLYLWADYNNCTLTNSWNTIDGIDYKIDMGIISTNLPNSIDFEIKIEWDWVKSATWIYKLVNK